jgi:hypothetical protein
LSFAATKGASSPAYLTQDQRGELSRSRISTIAASKATKQVNDSGDDNNDNEKEEVQSIGKRAMMVVMTSKG